MSRSSDFSDAPSPEEPRLYALGRALGAGVTDDELAAVAAGVGDAPGASALRQRVEAARQADPAVEARYRELEVRLDAVTAPGPDAEAHFAALTASGRACAPPRAADRPAERPAMRLVARRRAWGLAAAAGLLLVGLYLGMFVAGDAGRPAGEQLAALSGVPEHYEGLRLRGGAGDTTPVTAAYDAALRAVHAARTGRIGPGPRYDAVALQEARQQLLAVARMDTPDGALGLEARFAAGRVALHLGDYAEARAAFETVVEREGPSAPDALALLAEMDRRDLQ